MSLKERRDARHLVGLDTGREPTNPYRSVDRGDEMGMARAYASEFGKMVELQLPRILQGQIEPDSRQRDILESAYTTIWEELSPLQRKTYKFYELGELGRACTRLAEPTSDWLEFEKPKEPKNEALKNLLQNLDEVYEINLMGLYEKICKDEKLPQDYDRNISPYVRYLIQTALFLAREALNPTPLPLPKNGVWIPNLYVQDEEGKPLTQIDAVLTTPAVKEKLTKSNPTLEEILKAVKKTEGGAWEMIEIRLLLRDRYNTGPDGNKLRRPLRRSLRGLQERLGILALWWYGKRKRTFPFPTTLKLIYVRSPSLRFYNIHLDSAFFEEWIEGLTVKQGAFRSRIQQFKETRGISDEELSTASRLEKERARAERDLDQALEKLGITEEELLELGQWEEDDLQKAFTASWDKESLGKDLNKILEEKGISQQELPAIVAAEEKEAETAQLIEILLETQKTAKKQEKREAREGRKRLQALRKKSKGETGEEVVLFERPPAVEEEPIRPKMPRKKGGEKPTQSKLFDSSRTPPETSGG